MQSQQRKSTTHLEKIYYWTATIYKWILILEPDENKDMIISFLQELSNKGLIKVYGFVIMPNHIHLIWEQCGLNGKELPKSSLLKHTGHKLLQQLKVMGKSFLFEVKAVNKKHEIWQRDSLGVEVYSRDVAKQKLDYIHGNPVTGKWWLAKDDISYYYSSARFYETGIDDFGFLKNLYLVFDGE